MDTVTVRANVPLPDLPLGEIGTLPRTRRVAGLLASRRLTLASELADDEVPAGTVAEVLAWVSAGDPVDRAWRAERAERARERPRSTLLAQLEQLGAPGRDESAEATPEG